MPPEIPALRPALKAGAEALAVALDDAQLDLLLAYLDMLSRWNKVYNLTALREPSEMLTHHLLDSLAVVVPLRQHLAEQGKLQDARVLDVGSGAGLPGVVLSIALPELMVTCIDTVGKKASFIQQVAAELRLPRLRSQHARVEQWPGAQDGRRFDVITSRAFSSLSDFVGLTRQHLAPQGAWMAMKGKRPDDEQQALPSDVAVFHVEQLNVPGLAADRCLTWIQPSATH